MARELGAFSYDPGSSVDCQAQELDWKRHEILGWSPICSTMCHLKAHSPTSAPRLEEAPNLAKVPTEYYDLKEVFCKSRATSLPPHRPYDCAIELKPGTTPPRGRLFSLSRPETEAMDQYLSEAFAAGIIRPSSSPAGVGFFFVGKKDGVTSAMYRLPSHQWHHHKEPVPSPIDDYGIPSPARSHYLHHAWSTKRLSSRPHLGGGQVEDGVQQSHESLEVSCNAFRINERSGRLPGTGERCAQGHD